MVSRHLGFWSSPKGVWCWSSQRETKRVTLCSQRAARCVGLEKRQKGFHNFAVAHLLAPTTLPSYGTQALVSSEALYSHSPKTSYPTCYFYQLFLPSCPPPTSLSLLLEKSPPTYTPAAALLCPELQDTKQQENTWQLCERQQAPASPSPLLAQSSVTAIHSAWAMGMQERWPACLGCDSTNRTFGNLLMATFSLLTDTISPAGTLSWLTHCRVKAEKSNSTYKIHNRFLPLMDEAERDQLTTPALPENYLFINTFTHI